MTLEEIKKLTEPILRKNSVEYAGVFGSVARGEASKDSDVDILVRFSKDISLLDHIGVAQELEDVLNRKVDLVTERSLKNSLVPSVKKDLKILYGQIKRPELL